jgi:hypothetical protein
VYKHDGWVSYPDWMGYGVGKPHKRTRGNLANGTFLPFEEALELVRLKKLRSQAQVRRRPLH